MEKDRLEAFGNLIGNSAKSLTKIKSKGMSPYGLGSTHTVCLRKLYSNGVMTRSCLAELCELDRSQISRVIGDLIGKGYVIESGGENGYRAMLDLSDEGRKVTEEVNGIVEDVLNFVSGAIPSENIEMFYTTFEEICSRLKQAEELDWNKKIH